LTSSDLQDFIHNFFAKLGIDLFGIADIKDLSRVKDDDGHDFRTAISFAVPMNPEVMAGIEKGPNQYYAEEYARVNGLINMISFSLAGRLKELGYPAKALPASERTDPSNLKGDFPHKTAATRAGLGWIGRNCQLICKPYGPWLRLGTVFMNLPGEFILIGTENLFDNSKLKTSSEAPRDKSLFGKPLIKSFCGDCQECVEACPANALTGNLWQPGIPREKLLDTWRCDNWKKEHYYQFHKGHNCGICAAVCPFGKKRLSRKQVL